MSQWSYIKKPNWVGDGKDAYSAANVVATMKGWEYQPSGEVLVAIGALTVKSGDVIDQANVPTFTAVVSYSGTEAMITGDVMTVTLTSSEPVNVSGSPTIDLTIDSVTRTLAYNAGASTDTSLVFEYVINAADVAPVWTASTVYSIGDIFLQGAQWYGVDAGYTSGTAFNNTYISTVNVTAGGSGFKVSSTLAVIFSGGTGINATANATTDATGLVTAIAVLTGGDYSVPPTSLSVANDAVNITAATWLVDTATITAAGHGFATGYEVSIVGMTPAGYNGVYTVTVVDQNTFTYPLAVDPTGAGTVFGTATSTVVESTVVINSIAFDTPNITAAAPQVVVAATTTGGTVSDILPTGALVTASVTFVAPDTTAATAN